MAKKKKDKKKAEGAGLPQAAIHLAETVAGLIGSPTGRLIMAEALRAAADALVRDRPEAAKTPAGGEAHANGRSSAEVAVGIVGDAATRLVSALVSGDGSPAPDDGAKREKKKRSRATNSADPAASISGDDLPPAP